MMDARSDRSSSGRSARKVDKNDRRFCIEGDPVEALKVILADQAANISKK